MFFVDGYIPLHSVTQILTDEATEMHRAQYLFSGDSTDKAEKANHSAWIQHAGWSEGMQSIAQFCLGVEFIGILTQGGSVIRVSKEIFSDWTGLESSGANVNVYIGTVGSGYGYDDDYTDQSSVGESPPEKDLLLKRFGPFLGCPIIFREEEFNEFFKRLINWEGRPSDRATIWGKDIVRKQDDIGPEGIKDLRPLGRPKAGGGLLEKALRNEFLRRLQKGELSNQKEAVKQEAIEWVLRLFELPISRTSVSRHLKPIFEKMDDQK